MDFKRMQGAVVQPTYKWPVKRFLLTRTSRNKGTVSQATVLYVRQFAFKLSQKRSEYIRRLQCTGIDLGIEVEGGRWTPTDGELAAYVAHVDSSDPELCKAGIARGTGDEPTAAFCDY